MNCQIFVDFGHIEKKTLVCGLCIQLLPEFHMIGKHLSNRISKLTRL